MCGYVVRSAPTLDRERIDEATLFFHFSKARVFTVEDGTGTSKLRQPGGALWPQPYCMYTSPAMARECATNRLLDREAEAEA